MPQRAHVTAAQHRTQVGSRQAACGGVGSGGSQLETGVEEGMVEQRWAQARSRRGRGARSLLLQVLIVILQVVKIKHQARRLAVLLLVEELLDLLCVASLRGRERAEQVRGRRRARCRRARGPRRPLTGGAHRRQRGHGCGGCSGGGGGRCSWEREDGA